MNYTELVAASQAYADRQDTEVAASIDTFILLMEARVNRVLKTRQQSHRIQAKIVEDRAYYPLPADYAGTRQIEILTYDPADQTGDAICSIMGTCQPCYLTPEQITIAQCEGKSNQYFTIEHNQIHIYPVPTPTAEVAYAIELLYYRKLPNLNSEDTTNWASVDHPDIYLSGMCAEIELFAKNYKAADGWHERMSKAIDELDNSDEIERWSGSQLVIRNG